jgi:hypothetical protein
MTYNHGAKKAPHYVMCCDPIIGFSRPGR